MNTIKCTKISGGRGSAPDPSGELALPKPLAEFGNDWDLVKAPFPQIPVRIIYFYM